MVIFSNGSQWRKQVLISPPPSFYTILLQNILEVNDDYDLWRPKSDFMRPPRVPKHYISYCITQRHFSTTYIHNGPLLVNCTILLFGGKGVGIKSILYTVPRKVYIVVYSPLINVHSLYSVKLDVRTFTEIADIHSLGYMGPCYLWPCSTYNLYAEIPDMNFSIHNIGILLPVSNSWS